MRRTTLRDEGGYTLKRYRFRSLSDLYRSIHLFRSAPHFALRTVTPAAVCAPEFTFERIVCPADHQHETSGPGCTICELVFGTGLFPSALQNTLLGRMATLWKGYSRERLKRFVWVAISHATAEAERNHRLETLWEDTHMEGDVKELSKHLRSTRSPSAVKTSMV